MKWSDWHRLFPRKIHCFFLYEKVGLIKDLFEKYVHSRWTDGSTDICKHNVHVFLNIPPCVIFACVGGILVAGDFVRQPCLGAITKDFFLFFLVVGVCL